MWLLLYSPYTAISRQVVGKNVHATIPKGDMGYDRYTVPDDCSCRSYFCSFWLELANTFSWPFVPILLNFSEERWTQNHPQCLSGLLRALFPTTFLEIVVYLDLILLRFDLTLISGACNRTGQFWQLYENLVANVTSWWKFNYIAHDNQSKSINKIVPLEAFQLRLEKKNCLK